jgi:hypothetical protein
MKGSTGWRGRLWGLGLQNFCLTMIVLGNLSIVATAAVAAILRLPVSGARFEGSVWGLAAGMVLIALPESLGVAGGAELLRKRLGVTPAVLILWIVWALAHLALQYRPEAALRGLPPAVAGWAFILPYFRVRAEGSWTRAYWSTVAVHAGINLTFAAALLFEHSAPS